MYLLITPSILPVYSLLGHAAVFGIDNIFDGYSKECVALYSITCACLGVFFRYLYGGAYLSHCILFTASSIKKLT